MKICSINSQILETNLRFVVPVLTVLLIGAAVVLEEAVVVIEAVAATAEAAVVTEVYK